ncbi:hypothetical protein, partial [Marivita sp.]|uniref:hypothetical protein n=1 Tax=Marivita sp. TaxID=2003365 RepID=UPI002608227A
ATASSISSLVPMLIRLMPTPGQNFSGNVSSDAMEQSLGTIQARQCARDDILPFVFEDCFGDLAASKQRPTA